MVSKPEMDVITIKLRELQCTCYARSKKANEALACANRVHQHDGESIEAFKRKCEAHSTIPLPHTHTLTLVPPVLVAAPHAHTAHDL